MLTGLLTILVALVPGTLLTLAVPSGTARWLTLSAAPVLTLGLVSVAMAWLGLLGLPNSALAVLVAEFAMAIVAVVASRLVQRRRRSEDTPAEDAPASRARWSEGNWHDRLKQLPRHRLAPDAVSLAVPTVVAVAFGWYLLGRLRFPPGWDAENHAVLSRNILRTGSTAITSACTTGPTHSAVSCTFYPLATNVTWAQGAELSGGRIGAAMLAWSIVIGPVALVAAGYAATRLLGARPPVAGAVGLAITFLGPAWYALLTGRPTQAFGPGLAVSVATLAALALRGRNPVRMGLLAGLGAGGLAMTHTYDLLFTAVLALVFALTKLRSVQWRAVGLAVAAMITGMAAALAPFAGALAGASGNRDALPPSFPGDPGSAFYFWVLKQQRYILLGFPGPIDRAQPVTTTSLQLGLALTLTCLIASPLCLLYRQLRWARPWLAAWVAWTAIAIWTSSSTSSIAQSLAHLWYGQRERERTMILPLYGVLVVAGACGIALSVHWAIRSVRHRSWQVRPATLAASVGALALGGGVLAGVAAPATRVPLQQAILADAPAGNAYPRAFNWLKAHTPKGDVVAADHNLEYMTWVYSDYRVPTLFGLNPIDRSGLHDINARTAAFNWLVDNPGSTAAGCGVREYRIAYVAIGKRRVPHHGLPNYKPSRLAASPRLDLAYAHGGIKIYRVNAAGRACPNP